MKRISFFLALALIIASFGIAGANSVSVDGTTGIWDDGGTPSIIPGAPVTFDIRVTNSTGGKVSGITNGFAISGSSAPYTPLFGWTIDSTFKKTPLFFGDIARFDVVWAVGLFADGVDADTVGFGGAASDNIGLTAGYDELAYKLETGNFTDGDVICLDSAFYPPSGAWKWAEGNDEYFPSWDGPHCYPVKVPTCLAPDWDNPVVALGGSHCDAIAYDFDATLNPINVNPGTLVFSSTGAGTINSVTGEWSYAPTLADVGTSMSVIVTVGNGDCSQDMEVTLTFTNEAPQITCAPATDIATGMATLFTVSSTDDCDQGSVVYSIGATSNASASVSGDEVSITPDGEGAYSVEVIASDGNAETSCFITGTAISGSLFQVEIPCVGDQQSNFVFQGQHVSIPITLNEKEIGGYDLLIAYDNSALSFQSATPGSDLTANTWEYFTYRYGANGNCSNACPSGLLRLTAIAETNNGPNHPDNGAIMELAVMDFLVTNDRTFECTSIPVRFFWLDCGDNALSNWTGDELHISEVVFDGDPILFPPNGNEIQNETYGYPTYFGAQDADCFTDPNKAPIRDVSFNNGCVFVACADSIDARGDLNLNSVSNEIADAVLYSNYFVYGIGVFTVNYQGQVAASDVNADGLTLSVADLVYLIRVIVGDALPYAKLSAEVANVTVGNNVVTVDAKMGAALVIIEGNVNAELLADNMTMESNFDGVNTRVLVYSLEGNSFDGTFLNANGNVVSVELGSAEGAVVTSKLIPANFELAQNYPNPFNPSTTVGFSIPAKSDIILTVYNVTGQKVAEFSGAYEAGIHTIEWDASAMASGIYFYKLNAGDFSDTKKMVLLK